MQKFLSRPLSFTSASLLAASVLQLFTAWLQFRVRMDPPVLPESAYTWEGTDYPNSLPLDLSTPVALTMEDTRHFALNFPDSQAEYWAAYPGNSEGFVRLGPRDRFFGVSMYHQLHCVDALRMAILGDSVGAAMPFGVGLMNQTQRSDMVEKTEGHEERDEKDGLNSSRSVGTLEKRKVMHVDHCLNYLRTAILCAADTTLEPELYEGASDVGEGIGTTHVCRDWSVVHDFVERNFLTWDMAMRKGANPVTPKS